MEIEMKIPLEKISSIDNIISHLSQMYGAPYAEITQCDIYFQSPVRNFWNTDEALRIRNIQSKNDPDLIEITYKGPKEGKSMKVREEITINVSDSVLAREVLEKLGFHGIATVEKKRINWRLKNAVIISYDEVKGLGPFLEIEMLSSNTSEEITRKKEQINRIVKEIVPNWDGTDERRSYLELLILQQKI
ncbi:MAG: class IV adenylate cyclase [Candidatus Hodarchaeales archaeon]|jgi:adenylate cyclase class 2